MEIPHDTRSIRISVRPNARKSRIVKYDPERDIYIVEIAAKPENNKANIEVVKFFSRELGRRVCIAQGLTSKDKVLRIEDKA